MSQSCRQLELLLSSLQRAFGRGLALWYTNEAAYLVTSAQATIIGSGIYLILQYRIPLKFGIWLITSGMITSLNMGLVYQQDLRHCSGFICQCQSMRSRRTPGRSPDNAAYALAPNERSLYGKKGNGLWQEQRAEAATLYHEVCTTAARTCCNLLTPIGVNSRTGKIEFRKSSMNHLRVRSDSMPSSIFMVYHSRDTKLETRSTHDGIPSPTRTINVIYIMTLRGPSLLLLSTVTSI